MTEMKRIWESSSGSAHMRESIIRQVYRRTAGLTGHLSFAAGIPGVEAHPGGLVDLMRRRLGNPGFPNALMAYSDPCGLQELRAALTDRLAEWGVSAQDRNLLITCGAQQALDLAMKALITPKDRVLVPDLTFPGATQCFALARAELSPVRTDQNGIVIDERLVAELAKGARLLYLIPDHDNPTGRVLPESRRRDLLTLTRKYDTVILEDTAYYELRYDRERQLPLAAPRDGVPNDHVISVGSFSKSVAPDLRLGWIGFPAELARTLEMVKQGADITTGGFWQAPLADFLRSGYSAHLERITGIYREKRDRICTLLRRRLPDLRFECPAGGFFLWLELPAAMDAYKLFEDALIQEQLIVIPGQGFSLDGTASPAIRLAFSALSPDEIDQGIEKLARVVARQ